MANPYNPEHSVQEEYGDLQPNNSYDNNNGPEKQRSGIVGGAAIAGGVAGLVIVGPIIGIVGAAAAAGLAFSNTGKAGDVARASGDVVASAGDRARDLDNKHGIMDKTKNAASVTAERAKRFDQTHHVVDKTKNAAKFTVGKTVEGLRFISEKLNRQNK